MSRLSTPSEIAAPTLRPLCVDLDGTLVKSDTLADSLLVLARSRPALLWKLPGRLLFHGKAAFKAFVTESIALDVTHLPYNRKVLELLEEEHRKGRDIYLTTGANEDLARRVAEHLDLFTDVLASDSSTNLIASRKLECVRSRLGDAFGYIGDDTPDLPLLEAAAESMVANPSLRLRMKLRLHGIHPVRRLDERASTIESICKAMRPHQWIKNLLIPLPLLLAHILRFNRVLAALIAICCFSLTSSAVYILNDLLDIEVDRRHARKRSRPFAAGELSAATGLFLFITFLAIAFAVTGLLLPPAFAAWLLIYLVTTTAYSSFLKRIALIDVFVLAGLYTLRLLAGAAATKTHISPWLAGFSIFLFFSLAIAKRFAELESLRSTGSAPQNDRGYFVTDLDQLRTFGTSSAFAAVIVFAIYIGGSDVAELYRHPGRLWLIMPLMILWLCRVWLLASRGTLNEDPVVFALTDRTSQVIGALVAIIAYLAI